MNSAPPKTDLEGVVARVEHAHAADLDHEHRRAEHVPRVVAPELDAAVLNDLMEIDQLDPLRALVEVCLQRRRRSPPDGRQRRQRTVRAVRAARGAREGAVPTERWKREII